MSPILFRRSHQQRGVALFVGLVFLVVLSLISIIAMKGTLLETRMSTSSARHEQAFETSETLRTLPVSLFDEHVFERGWPTELGGALPDADFNYQSDLTSGMLDKVNSALQNDCSGTKTLLYGQLQSSCGALVAETLYDPSTWHPDMKISICDVSSDGCTGNVSAVVSVVPDGQILSEGAGGAQAAGYRGLGVGSAGGGGSMYFEIKSVGSASSNGTSITHSQYRQSIRN
ncbi:MAG: PilX N-terminal domain-containing pilus assembly protein [Rhodanobacter sp.]